MRSVMAAVLSSAAALDSAALACGMTCDAMHYTTRDAMVAPLDGCPQRGSMRLAMATALSSTAALDSAASAWRVMPCIARRVMPCITRRLPTTWQHALGNGCRA